LSLILDISYISRLGIKNIVGDNLGATIREGNTVFSIGGVTISVLIGSKVSTTVSIIDSIAIIICWWNISINGSWAIGRSWSIGWNWGICWSWGIDRFRSILGSSTGHSQKSRNSNE
jgi:hypothetical protein